MLACSRKARRAVAPVSLKIHTPLSNTTSTAEVRTGGPATTYSPTANNDRRRTCSSRFCRLCDSRSTPE